MKSKIILEDILTEQEKFFYDKLSFEYDRELFKEIIINRYLQSGTDYLTGLYNKQMLDFRLNNLANEYKRTNNDFAIIYYDLDGFKQINDTYGHKKGDEVLINFANILKNQYKRKDDNIFRIGGDEFIVCLYKPNEKFIIDSIRLVKAEYNNCSAGYCFYSKTENVKEMLDNADKMMYEDKKFK